MPKHNSKFATKKPWRDTTAWDRMIAEFEFNRKEFKKHYHLRSNVESTFSALKRKFLPYARSKNPVSQKNEILLKVCCHNASVLINAIFELGARADFKTLKL